MNTDQKDFLSILAYLYLQHSKLTKSVVLFEALHELYPDDMQVMKSLSYNYYLLKDYPQALSLLNYVIDHCTTKQDLIVSHLLKAKILWANGEHEEARTALKIFIENQNQLS